MEEMEEEAEDESILEIFPVHACVAKWHLIFLKEKRDDKERIQR